MHEIDINAPDDPQSSRDLLHWRMQGRRKAAAAVLGAIAVIVAIMVFVLFSPLLLRQLGRVQEIPWARLSKVGQTYGAASAFLSAVALIGVSLSLIVQARQAKAERIRLVRERQMELLRIVLGAPDVYGPVLGRHRSSGDDKMRRSIFATMLMNYLYMGYQMGVISERALREEAFRLAFGNEPMRTWWIFARNYWVRTAEDQKMRQFIRIADEEYQKAVTAVPPSGRAIVDLGPEARTSQDPKRWGTAAGMALGVAVGILVRSRMWSRRR